MTYVVDQWKGMLYLSLYRPAGYHHRITETLQGIIIVVCKGCVTFLANDVFFA